MKAHAANGAFAIDHSHLSSISILVVDDERANVRLLELLLGRAGYTNVRATTKPHEALRLAMLHPPDIVLLDLHMPDLSGVDLIHQFRKLDPLSYPLVVVLTGDDTKKAKADALSAGAKDFITKPFDTAEVLLRIRNLADVRLMHKQLQRSNQDLERKVKERTAQLEAARLDVLDRLAMAAEFRDDATGQHTRRVGLLSARLARAVGLAAADVELIARAAPLHDVGKIAIPDSILLKPGPLTPEETQVMRTHTLVGGRLLSSSGSQLLEMARQIALTHHERWDGTGYPCGQSGSRIPIAGRIVALADFFDALTHDRPYRTRVSTPEVVALIQAQRGRHFDPDVLDAFLDISAIEVQ